MTQVAIPLAATPSQTITTNIGGQRVRLNVYQKRLGLFVDVYADDVLIIGGVIARNMVRIVRQKYLGFVGDLWFYDTQGAADPNYSGLADRFVLLYSDTLP